jgi:hypothetical protein
VSAGRIDVPSAGTVRDQFDTWAAARTDPIPPGYTALWLGWRAGHAAAAPALYDIWARATDPGLSDATARELIVEAARAAIAKTEAA